MKKSIAVVLAILFVFPLAACGAKAAKAPTAEEFYQFVIEKNQMAEQMDCHMEMQMKAEAQDDSLTELADGALDVTMSGDVRGEHVGKPGMRMAMPMQMQMLGMTIETNTYFADGYLLMDMMGMKVKTPLPIEEALEQFTAANVQPLEYVDDLAITQDAATGLYTVTYTMNMEKALEISEGYVGSMFGNLSEVQEQFTWDSCSGALVADADGNLRSQTMDMVFSFKIEGVPVRCAMAMDCAYHEIGPDFRVEIPDPAEYTEADAEALGLAA